MKNTNINRHWVLGYLEGRVNFSILINLLQSTNKKYIIFKPIVSIKNTSKKHLDIIKNELGLSLLKNRVIQRESLKNLYELFIQDEDTVQKIINYIGEYEFVSDKKQNSFTKFKEGFHKIIKLQGQVERKSFNEWHFEFEELLDIKLSVNDTNSGFKKKKWIDKIKNHLLD